jgi:acyl-homoserine-lactone acylase
VHSIDESPDVRDPSTGWLQNTNDWPYSSAGLDGPDSPKAKDFPAYFDAVGETPRGVAAVRVLREARAPFSLESLLAAAYDPRLPELEAQLPLLLAAWKAAPAADPVKKRTAEAIAALRAWDVRWAADSVATTLAVLWAEALWKDAAEPARAARLSGYAWMRTRVTPRQRLAALDAVLAKLTADFGSWKQPWGELNRFQRPSGAIEPTFSDAQPSLPVAFAPGRWGSLASFAVAPPAPGASRRYGVAGNSFVAVVELGKDRVRARAVTAGGLSNDVTSKHFNDQGAHYARGALREVYFYPEQLTGHTERTYHPGK